MAMGIWGLLLKEYAPEALLDCLRQVISGEKWLPAELVSKAAHAPQDSGERKIELLTRREREITELICGGLSNRCIADTLGTSEGTITVHLHNIYQKLEITTRKADRKSVVEGKSVSVRVDLGGRSIIKTKEIQLYSSRTIVFI